MTKLDYVEFSWERGLYCGLSLFLPYFIEVHSADEAGKVRDRYTGRLIEYSFNKINVFCLEFPTCCARLRCVVEVNGERIVQTRGQPGELFPDK